MRCIARPTIRRYLPKCSSPKGWIEQIINGAFLKKRNLSASLTSKPGSREKTLIKTTLVVPKEFMEK